MARISDVLGRGRRRPRPLDSDTARLVANRQVPAGTMTVPHYDPSSPQFGGRDLHDSGRLQTAWDGPHREGSAVASSPLIAAVVPAENYVRQMRSQWSFSGKRPSSIGHVEKWEADIFRMMRKGPGFVSSAASMYGDWMAGSGGLVLQERAGRDSEGRDEWVQSSYEPGLEILRMWRGEDRTQADLIREALTFLDSVGQFYQGMRKADSGSWVYDLWAHSAVTANPDTLRIEARGREDADHTDPLWFNEYPPQLVDHLFLSDKEWKGRPTSQFERLMPDIYRLILAERSMDRDLLSRLASNGVFWSKATNGGKDWTQDFAEWAAAAFSGTFDPDYLPGLSGSLEEVAPFPMISVEKPEFVEIGRDLSRAREVADMAWNAITLGLDMPKGAMEGNEAANRWTGFLNRDEESVKAAAPRMQRLAAMVQRSHFLPWARILGLGRPVDDFRVWYELPDVRPERTSEKLSIAPLVVPTRQALAEVVGWGSGDLADMPEGMTDFEAIFLMRHGKPYQPPKPPPGAQAEEEEPEVMDPWDIAEQLQAITMPDGDFDAEDLDAARALMNEVINGPEFIDPVNGGAPAPGGPPAPAGPPSAGAPAGIGLPAPTPGVLAPGVRELGAPTMPNAAGPPPVLAALGDGPPEPLPTELDSWDELVPR